MPAMTGPPARGVFGGRLLSAVTANERACVVPFKQHVALPAVGETRVVGEKSVHREWSVVAMPICSHDVSGCAHVTSQ